MLIDFLYSRLRTILIKKVGSILKIVEEISLTSYLMDTEFDDNSAK